MSRSVIQFLLIAMIVAIIGGFTGWYFFIKSKVADTNAADQGRGSENTSFTGDVGSTYQNIVSDTVSLTGEREVGTRAPRLWQITKSPVAGFGFAYDTGAVFFAERATGNILKADPEISSIVRMTNTLIPKVREATFSRSGDVILQTTDDAGRVTTFAATIATTTAITSTSTPNILSGTYLQEGIVAVSAGNREPTAKGILLVAENPEGGAVVASATWKGLGQKALFTTALRQWRAQLLPDGRGIVTQKPTDGASGYSLMINANGSVRNLVSDKPGLIVVHHDTSNAFLYSTSKNGSIELYTQIGADAPVKLPISTTADKCVWAPGAGLIAYCAVPNTTADAAFLQKRYQGALHTEDAIWKVEAGAGTAERFFTTDTRIAFDAEDLAMDDTGAYLGFRSASDKSLWLLRIAE